MQTVVVDVFKIYVNLFTRCDSMYHSCIFVQTIQENYVRDTLNWPLSTVFKCEVAPVQFMFSSYEAISFIFWIYSFQIYNFRIQINVGASGATDVTKYLKLSKLTNFLWGGEDGGLRARLLKNCCFLQ